MTGSDIDREEDMQEESNREKIDRKRWTEIERDIGGDRERRGKQEGQEGRKRQRETVEWFSVAGREKSRENKRDIADR